MKTPKEIEEDKEFLRSIEEIRCRMNGETTRRVDAYIQELYKNKGEWIEIYDHFPSINAHRMILEKIIRRMEFEHPQDKLEIDKMKNRLKLSYCVKDGLWSKIDEEMKYKESYKNESES